ncbi:MAG: hypothetical protein QG604_64 [Candidatus Dependentiae bacterium]|nr:hypothetical protein [Candidatus Dependentiae bacterium]
MILIALEYLILASTFTVAKKVLSYCPYLFLLTTRFSIGALLLLGFMQYRGGIVWHKVWRDRWLFLLAGILHIYLAFVLEFWALQYISSAKTALIYAMTPFIAALLSYFLYKERLSVRQLLGILVGTVGLAPIFMTHDGATLTELFCFSLPECVLCGAVISAAAAWFAIKALMARGHNLVVVNGIAMGVGALLCGVTMAVVAPDSWRQVSDWQEWALWLSLLIFLSQVVSYNLYSWLLTRYSITFMTLCGFLCPLFSAGLGALFLHETITWHYWISLGAVCAGLYLFTRKPGASSIS